MKGIGPATASLLLAVHDPENVIFFSDEVYRWLCADGEKVSPKYTIKEFDEIHGNAKTIMDRLKVSPIEVEKAAFVIIKENEPVYEPKPKSVPSGKPRGRPAKAEGEKELKKETVPGRGRGHDPRTVKVAQKTPLGEPKPRGRPAAVKAEKLATPAKSEPKRRGRPAAVKNEEVITPAKAGDKRRAEEEATPGTGASKRAKV